MNWKDPRNPIPATAVLCHGRELAVTEVEDTLDSYLTAETGPSPQESAAVNGWADGDCAYVDAMISGWAQDRPSARHPWLLSGATRLACARRYGCLTQATHEAAKDVLDQRMAALCAGDSGVPREYFHAEFKDAICWGEERASELRDAEIAAQLGGHTHDQGAPFELQAGRFKGIPMGQRFARERLAGRFLLVDERGWMIFDGVKWVHCSEDDVRSEAVEWAEAEIIALIKDHADHEELVACLRYREPRGINDLLAGASTERTIRVKATAMDADPYLLNTPNGAIDLRTGEVVPCSPQLLCTKATGAQYHPDAHSEHWEQALTALPPEVENFLQLRLGQMLIGEPVPTDEVLFLVGSGEIGKSLVHGSVQRAFRDYAVSVPETLLLAHTNQHPTETMQLKGARLALLEELPESRHLNASQLKKIIGTDKLTGRYLYEGRMPWPVRSHVSHAAEPKATTATSTRMTTTNPENPTNSYSAPSESTLRLVYVWSPIGSKVLDRGGGGLGFGTISLSEVGIGAIGQGDAPSGETLDGCPSVTGMCLYGTQLARCRLI